MAPDAVTGINTHDDCSAILAVIDLQVVALSRISLYCYVAQSVE